MRILPTVPQRWTGPCIVAASGPSLTADVARQCAGHRVIAVNDAWRLLPAADVLYAADAAWWNVHEGARGFGGERWTTDQGRGKAEAVERWGLTVVRGVSYPGFSIDPKRIHYGGNSGFQAVNLAILFGANPIFLVGFDMRIVEKRAHFFGAHPPPLRQPDQNFGMWIGKFTAGRVLLPPHIVILNATPGSALKCFPFSRLPAALEHAA